MNANQQRIQQNTKIRILSPEHSEYVQKLAFEAGFWWRSFNRKEVMLTSKPYLFFRCGFITWGSQEKFFLDDKAKEIFIDIPETKESTMNPTQNPFINTYIDTSSYSKKDILPLAKKYSEASGLPLNDRDLKEGLFIENTWKFMFMCRNKHDFPSRENIYVTDDFVESLRQITEQDLDDYLAKKKYLAKKNYPDFDFKIDLSGMNKDQKAAAKQWIKEAALARFGEADIDSLDTNYNYFTVALNSVDKSGIEWCANRAFFCSYKQPEVQLTFTTKVKSWNLDQSSLLKEKEELEQKLKEINKMLDQNN